MPPSRDPEDHRCGQGDQGRAVGVGSPFLVARHPQQFEQIEPVFGQGEGGREQPHGGVPNRRLEQRVPLQDEDEQENERKPSPAASFEDVPDGCQRCHGRLGYDFGGEVHGQ